MEILKRHKGLTIVGGLAFILLILLIIINIKYKNSTNKNKALEIANGTLELFDEEVLEDYDLEYLLIQEEDDKEDTLEYKIAGTKHHLHDYISYSKN